MSIQEDIETVTKAAAIWVAAYPHEREAVLHVIEAARASETWLRRSTTAEAEAEYQTARAEAAETKLAEVTAERDAMHVAALRERIRVLEEALLRLASDADELCSAWDAYRKLQSGFGGMGVNILQEDAGRLHSATYWVRLKRSIDAARAASTPEEREG